MLRWPEALKFFQDEARQVFGTSHLDDKTLANSKNDDTVLLLRAAEHDLTNSDMWKVDFSVFGFYKAGAQYVSTLWALFMAVLSHN